MNKEDMDNYFNMENDILTTIKQFIDKLLDIEQKYKTTIKKIDSANLDDDGLIELLAKHYDSNILSMLLVSGNRTNSVRERMQNYNELTTKEKKELSKEITELIKKREKIGVKRK